MTKPATPNPAIRPAAMPKLRHRTARAVAALVIREMTTTYGRSPGGYVWAVAQPVALVMLFAFAFSLMLRHPPLGINFITFYASGLLPLRMFQVLSVNVGGAVQYSKPLLGYPRVTFIDAILGRAILTVMTQLVVTAIIFGGIMLWYQSSDIMHFEIIFQSFLLAIGLGVGVGTLNCFLFTLFPVWRLIWGIATGPLLLISAVLYIYDDIPRFAQNILWYNPLVHITGLSRMGFYESYSPSYINIPYVVAFSVIPAFFGVLMLRKYGRSILYL